jgi:hypothetical protein
VEAHEDTVCRPISWHLCPQEPQRPASLASQQPARFALPERDFHVGSNALGDLAGDFITHRQGDQLGVVGSRAALSASTLFCSTSAMLRV